MADPVYNPDYQPIGDNNRSNDYYKTVNHRRLGRNERTRAEFLTLLVGYFVSGYIAAGYMEATP